MNPIAFQSAVKGGGGGYFGQSPMSVATAITDLKEVKTVGEFLDLYIVHFLVTLVFVIGGIILTMGYVQNVSKPYSISTDFFIALGAISLAMNIIFLLALIGAWISHAGSPVSRDDGKIHWLHVISILASALVLGWGILALILTFGQTLTPSTPNETMVAGYFMTAISVIYGLYLVVRHSLGLAGRNKSAASAFTANTFNTASLLASLNNARPPSSTLPPSSAIFSGIDLSGLQPSSITTTTQRPVQQQTQAQAPCMMMPMPMMMQMPNCVQPTCSPDDNANVVL